MASKTVKCVSCDVVINELLAFLRNVLEFMDEESIHQLCTSSFTADDIVKAKTLLFESIATSKKMPVRRKDGKKKMSRDLDDIICLMKATDPDLFPIFVAKELHKLPPVTFDHVDATRLLKDILVLQNKCKVLEERMVTKEQFDVLKFEIQNMKCASLVDYHCCTPKTNVNNRRGACLDNSVALDSGPIGLQYLPISSTQKTSDTMVNNFVSVDSPSIKINRTNDGCWKKHKQRDTAAATGASESATSADPETSDAAPAGMSETDNALSTCAPGPIEAPTTMTFATAVSTGTVSSELKTVNSSSICESNVNSEQIVVDQNNEWTLVKHKSSKLNRLVSQRGRASPEPDVKFRAADVKVPLLISNVSTDTQEDDIIRYIKLKTNESVSLKKINVKSFKKYNAYKLFVSKHKVDVFLNDKLWPEGITFRRFVHFMYRTSSEHKVKVH
ncbi:hypothetical protein B5X24_HaOG215639 [Helicoverpa armigera]|uniref:Mutant cadherin n=1 Tax=Helicoverpa armigera TaxID=29058 RepID=A0A2W1CXM7_HELAM|nr:hypothetical protein B5X24_HaOG215639 [Helicoverpa armigera]